MTHNVAHVKIAACAQPKYCSCNMVSNIAENPSLRYPTLTHITPTGSIPTATGQILSPLESRNPQDTYETDV